MEYKYNGLKSPLWGGLHNPLFSPFNGSSMAGGGSAPLIDPLTLYTGGKKGIWIKPRDWATLFQNSGGTGSVTTAGDAIGRATDQSGRGNHMVQATATARPLAATAGGYPCADFDGTDDVLTTDFISFGFLGSNPLDAFVTLYRDTNTAMNLGATNSGAFLTMKDGDAVGASSGVGSSTTYRVNGVDVAGGTSTTRDQLSDASPTGQWLVVSCLNLSLSDAFQLANGVSSFFLDGKIAEFILCESVDDATRARIRTYLGSHVGLTL